jgi:hypothetical protein
MGESRRVTIESRTPHRRHDFDLARGSDYVMNSVPAGAVSGPKLVHPFCGLVLAVVGVPFSVLEAPPIERKRPCPPRVDWRCLCRFG